MSSLYLQPTLNSKEVGPKEAWGPSGAACENAPPRSRGCGSRCPAQGGRTGAPSTRAASDGKKAGLAQLGDTRGGVLWAMKGGQLAQDFVDGAEMFKGIFVDFGAWCEASPFPPDPCFLEIHQIWARWHGTVGLDPILECATADPSFEGAWSENRAVCGGLVACGPPSQRPVVRSYGSSGA